MDARLIPAFISNIESLSNEVYKQLIRMLVNIVYVELRLILVIIAHSHFYPKLGWCIELDWMVNSFNGCALVECLG